MDRRLRNIQGPPEGVSRFTSFSLRFFRFLVSNRVSSSYRDLIFTRMLMSHPTSCSTIPLFLFLRARRVSLRAEFTLSILTMIVRDSFLRASHLELGRGLIKGSRCVRNGKHHKYIKSKAYHCVCLFMNSSPKWSL